MLRCILPSNNPTIFDNFRYIVHAPSGRSFFLSAVIYTNANGIFNDDIYEYGLAYGYLADLAEVLARSALGIPLDQPPLTEPKRDVIPSTQGPKPHSDEASPAEFAELAEEEGKEHLANAETDARADEDTTTLDPPQVVYPEPSEDVAALAIETG